MRRFTLTSVTVLTGIALAPACGAVLGIDTERVLESEGGAPSATASGKGDDGGLTKGTSSGTSGSGSDSGPTNLLKCDPDACGKITNGFFGECVQGKCKRSCTGQVGSRCGAFGVITCPDDLDCLLECQGDGCNELTCRGGRSCTIDCTGGDCHDAECTSPSCTFLCKDNSCDDAECAKGSECAQLCFNGAGMKQDCKKAIKTDD